MPTCYVKNEENTACYFFLLGSTAIDLLIIYVNVDMFTDLFYNRFRHVRLNSISRLVRHNIVMLLTLLEFDSLIFVAHIT